MFITRPFDRVFRFKPDDDGGNADEGAQEGASSPQTVTIDGHTVSLTELTSAWQQKEGWQKANTERAQELAARERQLEERTFGVIDQLAQRHTQPAPAPKVEEAPMPSLREAFDGLDLIGDPDGALDKLANAIESRESHLLSQSRAEVERVNKEWQQRLEQTTAQLRTENNHVHALETVKENNQRVFDTVMSKHAEVLKNLPERDRNAVLDLSKKKIGDGYGNYDRNAQDWAFNEVAVEHALWSHPETRKRLLAQERAAARRDAMGNRLRGEEATGSSPGRATPTPLDSKQEAVMQKAQQINEALQRGDLLPEDAGSRMSAEEWRIWQDIRRQQGV